MPIPRMHNAPSIVRHDPVKLPEDDYMWYGVEGTVSIKTTRIHWLLSHGH